MPSEDTQHGGGAYQRGLSVDGYEHMKQKYEAAAKERQLFLGLLLGLSIGMLWEAIRR